MDTETRLRGLLARVLHGCVLFEKEGVTYWELHDGSIEPADSADLYLIEEIEEEYP